MRSILDAHPDVLCGTETKIIPSFLGWMIEWQKQWRSTPALIKELYDAGLSSSTQDTAASQFIKVIMENRFRKAKRFCAKDPYNADYILDLKRYFPSAKFILMMRDVRGVAFSYIDRLKFYNGSDSDYINIFKDWNVKVKTYKQSCDQVGPNSCMIVFYEHLVLNKTLTLRKLTKFLDIPWSDSMLNHEKFIGERVKISESEWSTSQIIQPIYTDSINAWVGKIHNKVLKKLKNYAPMLRELGYDPLANNSYNQSPI